MVITAPLASIGAAGIPMADRVMISVILTSVGLPLEGLGLILAVDRLLDGTDPSRGSITIYVSHKAQSME